MNPLLQQFIQESKDFLQGISEKLLQLEKHPDNSAMMTELFRLVHTLKGNSGLFEFPAMTRLLHGAEDLLDAVRDGQLPYSAQMADALLDAIDVIASQLDEIEVSAMLSERYQEPSLTLASRLRSFLPTMAEQDAVVEVASLHGVTATELAESLRRLCEKERMKLWRRAANKELHLVRYTPEAECFFKGEDPFFLSRQTPDFLAGQLLYTKQELSPDFDCYQSNLTYLVWSVASRAELLQHFRYVPEQVSLCAIAREQLIIPVGEQSCGPVYGDFVDEALRLLNGSQWQELSVAIEVMLDISAAELWLSSALRWACLLLEEPLQNRQNLQTLFVSLRDWTAPNWTQSTAHPLPAAKVTTSLDAPALELPSNSDAEALSLSRQLLQIQQQILSLPLESKWSQGRYQGAVATLKRLALYWQLPDASATDGFTALEALLAPQSETQTPALATLTPKCEEKLERATGPLKQEDSVLELANVSGTNEQADLKLQRRPEEHASGKVLKVEQTKVDRLMDLIGEMVVAKNSLPYLANRAESQFGVRELAKEIKAHYSVIDRIALEMQDAIMQIRMMPVSFIFQRFPRLVRDLSRKLGKEVTLVLEGEETEADKNMIEALADPLIHIVRNSLDHGLELPQTRVEAGKPATGRLLIRATQESDRAIIEVTDDGKGIDPDAIKRKAYEKGLIDESQLERLSDRDAVNLVFAAGFSTAETISDLSGRGVGMDVVRSALEKVGGTVSLQSTKGKGTTIRLALPLSMAVTNVMTVQSDGQVFGIPMDLVVETVRLPQQAILSFKQQQTTVLREKVIALKSLNQLLAIEAMPQANEQNELAVLVVRHGSEQVGLIVDNFNEVVDVILKPLPGELANLSCYAGSALLGDGSVLMVLNPRGLL